MNNKHPFQSIIQQLTTIFGSKTKAQEILLLLEQEKKVVRQGFFPEELPPVEQFCHEKNLVVVKSRFKVFLEGDGYTNKGLRGAEDDPRRGLFFVYISADEKSSWDAAHAEIVNDHHRLGKILAYPECCIRFFANSFSEKKTDLTIPSENLYTNLALRHHDCVILSHFPCKADCVESIHLGKRYFATIKKVDPLRAEEMENLFKIHKP